MLAESKLEKVGTEISIKDAAHARRMRMTDTEGSEDTVRLTTVLGCSELTGSLECYGRAGVHSRVQSELARDPKFRHSAEPV